MGIPLFDLLTIPCRTSLVKWQSKGKSRNNSCLLTNKFNRARWNKVFMSAFLYMSLDTPLLHVMCCHLLQPSHLALVNNSFFFCTQCAVTIFLAVQNEK